jgi:hypothetical protein
MFTAVKKGIAGMAEATIEGLAFPEPLWRGRPLPTDAPLPASPSRTCVLRPKGHTPLEPPTDLSF